MNNGILRHGDALSPFLPNNYVQIHVAKGELLVQFIFHSNQDLSKTDLPERKGIFIFF